MNPIIRHDPPPPFENEEDETDETTTTTSSPPAAIVEGLEARLVRLRRERSEREELKVPFQLSRDVDKEELLARCDRELGVRGADYVLIDTGFIGDPFVVMKKPAPVQFEKYIQGKMTPADRYDFIIPSLFHPTQAEYNELRKVRPAIDISVSNAMQPMMGAVASEEAGK